MGSSTMRKLLVSALTTLPLFLAACAGDSGPSPYDDDYGITSGNINEGSPNNDSLPDDNKADAVYPPTFELPKDEQSPVKSQGSRGVCSVFAATAILENLYIKAGMPVSEADFSEQYMQWSVKAQLGEFTWTEGSNVGPNLDSVVRFGTVKEAAWPYETTKWTTANDPACTAEGENLPMQCYTNGAPPQMAVDGQKWRLPSTRWVNINSMKAHLTTKKTGVGVGLDFFYQSWNHRKSTLPVDSSLWARGIVTYPNDEDKRISLEKRAGHAIEIIGWDDNMEVAMRDAQGKPVLDGSGNPVMEKGFWLFKNSWGDASFGLENSYGAGYGWLSMRYVKEKGSAMTADLPSLAPVAEVCDDTTMADEDGDGKANCDDTGCAAHPSCTSSGGTSHTYTSTPNASIPDASTTGATSTINVTDEGTVADVKVTTDVTHTYKGDLKITLTHGATTKIIFNKEGGSADNVKQTFSLGDFGAGALAGAWTLKVEDTESQDIGKLNSWQLEVTTR